MPKVNCSKYLRTLVTSVLIALFLCSVVQNFLKYNSKRTVVALGVKSALDVVYPSVTMCPKYKYEYALSKTSGSKNLTEYYENLVTTPLIRKDVVSISQPYMTQDG